MVRRWIIRSVAILICAVCVGSFVVGSIFHITAYLAFQKGVRFALIWTGSDIRVSAVRGASGPLVDVGWPRADERQYEIWQDQWNNRPHFAGFGGFTYDLAFGGKVYFIRLPLWFVALLSVLLLVWVFRRTRRPSPVAAFAIESKQTV